MSFPNSITWTDPPSSSQRSIGWKTTATKSSKPFKPPRPDNGWASQLGSDSLPLSIPRIGGSAPSFSFNTQPPNNEDKATSQFREGELVSRFDSRLEAIASGTRANRNALDAKSEQIMNQSQKIVTIFKEECKKLSKEIAKENNKTFVVFRDLLKKNNAEQNKTTRTLLDGFNHFGQVVTELSNSIKQQNLENKRTRQFLELYQEDIRKLNLKIQQQEDNWKCDQKRCKCMEMCCAMEGYANKQNNEKLDTKFTVPEPSQGSPVVVTFWDECKEEYEQTEEVNAKQMKDAAATTFEYSSQTDDGDDDDDDDDDDDEDDDDDDDDSLFKTPASNESQPSTRTKRPIMSGEDSLFTETPKKKRRLKLLNPLNDVSHVHHGQLECYEDEESEIVGKTGTLRRRWRKKNGDTKQIEEEERK